MRLEGGQLCLEVHCSPKWMRYVPPVAVLAKTTIHVPEGGHKAVPLPVNSIDVGLATGEEEADIAAIRVSLAQLIEEATVS